MQHVVTGLGPDGRSTVLERRDLSEPARDRVVVETIAGTEEIPPRLLASLAGQGEAANIGVPQVGSSWLIVKWPPYTDAYMHRTDTLDYDVVLSGQVTLLLEDGEVVLETGRRRPVTPRPGRVWCAERRPRGRSRPSRPARG